MLQCNIALQQCEGSSHARPVPAKRALYARLERAGSLEKAKTIPADALIFDLEDAVAPDDKALARDQVQAAVRNGGYGGREIVIRVNALKTPWGTDERSIGRARSSRHSRNPRIGE